VACSFLHCVILRGSVRRNNFFLRTAVNFTAAFRSVVALVLFRFFVILILRRRATEYNSGQRIIRPSPPPPQTLTVLSPDEHYCDRYPIHCCRSRRYTIRPVHVVINLTLLHTNPCSNRLTCVPNCT